MLKSCSLQQRGKWNFGRECNELSPFKLWHDMIVLDLIHCQPAFHHHHLHQPACPSRTWWPQQNMLKIMSNHGKYCIPNLHAQGNPVGQPPCRDPNNQEVVTCICYYYLSILGSYPSHFINAYGTNPTSQKNRKQPCCCGCRGSLGLLIGFCMRAGRIVDMPRVPDGRAG